MKKRRNKKAKTGVNKQNPQRQKNQKTIQKSTENQFCTNCGTAVEKEDRFCKNCGKSIIHEAPVEKEEPKKVIKTKTEKIIKDKKQPKPITKKSLNKKALSTEKQTESKKVKKIYPKKTKQKSISPTPFIIVLLLFGGFIWWFINQQKPAKVSFMISSELQDNEPPISDILINKEVVYATDRKGNANFVYKDAFIGDTLKVSFKKRSKNRYDSKDDFELIINNEVMKVNRTILFKRWIRWFTADITFQRTADFPVLITLNGDSIGSLINSNVFNYRRKYKEEDEIRLAFEVHSPGLNVVTEPPSLVYNINRDISSVIDIVALLDSTPIMELTLLEYQSRTPLPGIEVQFSDSEEPVLTDELGRLHYSIRERRYGKKISTQFSQKFLRTVSDFAPIILNKGMPDTLRDTLLFEVDYTIRVKVEDLNEQPIQNAITILDGIEKRTDKNGFVDFQIPRPDKFYSLEIKKSKYKYFSGAIRPIGFLHTELIKIEGTFGTIKIVDSLQTDLPVQYLDIYEGREHLSQTGKDGRSKIPILLAKQMNLLLKPAANSIYLPKNVELTFTRIHEIIEVPLSPKPFKYHFQVKNDKGQAINNVKITHRGSSHLTDKNGKVTIKIFLTEPKHQEEFDITWQNYQDKRFVSSEAGTRDYSTNIIIGSTVAVEIRTNPPNGNISVIDMTGKTVAEGMAPMITDLEFGTYRIKAANDRGQSTERIWEINTIPDEPLVLDMQNPIAMIERFYREQNFKRVVQIYEQEESRIQHILDTDAAFKKNKCNTLNLIATSFSKVELYENAAQLMEQLDQAGCSKTPYFYKNYAETLFQIKDWKKAGNNYQRAIMYIHYVPEAKRYQFHADCLYSEAQSMLYHYQNNRTNPQLSCSYLDDIGQLLDEYITIVEQNDLDANAVSVSNTQQRLRRAKKNCGDN